MTTHVRTQIRDAVATLLAGLETSAERVFVNRTHRVQPDDVPALLIYTRTEPAQPETTRGLQSRLLSLAVECYAAGSDADPVDDVLDRMAAEVEVAIAADPTLGGLSRTAVLTDTTIGLTDGAEPLGVAVLTFQIRYRTLSGVPDVAR